VPPWRGCPRGYCRRHKRCIGSPTGDQDKCLRRAWPLLSDAESDRIAAEVVRGGPRRISPASDREYRMRRYEPWPPQRG